ncbi:MAG TPA: hypothetical protein VF790_10695 [Dissulfurispiraceae bacterium]
MINFKITSLDNGFLNVEKPSGKAISLKLGEFVKAEVMEMLPSGGVTLKIKGDLIPAKTEIPLEKGATVLFKVTGQPADGKDLRLQFMGYAEETAQGRPQGDLKGEALNKLVQELNLFKGAGGSAEALPPETFTSERIENLIKALPPDINSLPKEIKLQLQDVLSASLKSTGQSIQSRLDTLLSQLSDSVKGHPLVETLKKDLLVNMEKLLGGTLKSALQNTGVALEAKLKSAVTSILLQQLGQEEQSGLGPKLSDNDEKLRSMALAGGLLLTEEGTENAAAVKLSEQAPDTDLSQLAEPNAETPAPAAPEQSPPEIRTSSAKPGQTPHENQTAQAQMTKGHPEMASVKGDLKAALLELKQAIEKGTDIQGPIPAKETATAVQGGHDNIAMKGLQGTIDGLIKDIETFQALSKTTDSFYTFLPVSWQELRDGEISFKRGQGSAGGRVPYSCRINLDLGVFGSLSIMVLMHNTDFLISFKAEKADFQSVLSSNLDELKGTFREKGLNLKAVNILEKDDSLFEQLEKLASSERVVNIKV